MSEEFRDWIINIIGKAYTPFQGQWVEDDSNSDSYYCVFQYGGRAPVTEVRYPSFTVLLLGPRNTRSAVSKLSQDSELVMQHVTSEGRSVPCGAANVRALREPVGPGYTVENRVWFSLQFEIII